MKRVAILVVAVAFTVSINTKVFANSVENSNSARNDTNINEVVNNGKAIMPDDIFYFVDKTIDNLKLFLTFDDAKKKEIILQIANEKYDLSKDIVKEFDKSSYKLDVSAKETTGIQLAKKETIANIVEKRQQLTAARQEYLLVKISLDQAKKSGDEAAIKVGEELLKEKQSLYKIVKEDFEISYKNEKNYK